MRRLAEWGAEGPDEMRFRDAGDAGESANVQRPGISALHSIKCAQHPAVCRLYRPAIGPPHEMYT